MDISRRPLLDNARDRRLYVPTGAVVRVERSTRDGLNVLVLGERGSGKTTLLRQLALRLREDGVPCAFVDAGLVNDPTMLMKLVRLEVGRSPTLLEALRDTLASPQREIDALGRSGELLSVIRSMRLSESGPDDGRMALLLDGLEAKLAHTVFGRLRDELWQLPFSWVACSAAQAVAKSVLFSVRLWYHEANDGTGTDIPAPTPRARARSVWLRHDPGRR